jgi:Fe-S oxidoreductase
MEYLMRSAKSDPDLIDTGFTGVIPQKVLYHTPCHLRAQNIGLPARDLLKLTGAKVELVQQCSGVDGTWGYKEQNYTLSKEVAFKLSEVLKKKGEGVLCGDCHLANYAIYEESGNKTLPLHPIQILAAAYGLLDDE